jgi:hypothetical protein
VAFDKCVETMLDSARGTRSGELHAADALRQLVETGRLDSHEALDFARLVLWHNACCPI